MEANQSVLGDQLLRIALATAQFRGPKFFAALAVCLCATLKMRFAFVTVPEDERGQRGQTLALADAENLRAPSSYALAGLPCQTVLGGMPVAVPCNVAEFHPGAVGMQAYCGEPLLDRQGRVIGLLAVEDSRPRSSTELQHVAALLRLLAARTACEIECALLTQGPAALLADARAGLTN